MGKGLGPTQRCILSLLLKAGGALATAGLLAGLFDQVPGPEEREYGLLRSSLSRTLRALRDRELVDTYGIAVAGHAAVIVSLTKAGVEVAREWEEEG